MKREGTPLLSRITAGPEATELIGFEIGKLLDGGFTIALCGELGSGKTVLTKGLCRGLDVTDLITSPTYIIINEYEGRVTVYHVDLYRVESEEEMDTTGLDHVLLQDGVCIIEWAEKMEGEYPSPVLNVFLEILTDSERRIELTPKGKEAEMLLAKLGEII
jgi:tRNA threonylcarbamoyladenosine biosynthesis protein TsaE